MVSLRSRLVVLALGASGRKRRFLDPHLFHRHIADERTRVTSTEPPPAVRARHAVTVDVVDGRPCYTLAPRGTPGPRHVLYLHGGAFVSTVTSYHWRFLSHLVDALGCTVTVPVYPLAPEHGHRDVFAFVTRCYRALAARVAPEHLALMGDSAGGGLALALAMALRDEGGPVPRDVVMLSPWLDLTASHPDLAPLERRDPWLARPGLAEAGRLVAREDDPAHPRLSPLHGELAGLGRLSLFIGTRDVLLADARRLRARAREAGVALHYVEARGMVHVWPLLPLLPEARATLAELVDLLRAP